MNETIELVLGFTTSPNDSLRSIYEHQLQHVECMTAFGWRKVEKVTRGNKDYQILTRDTNMSNYEQLKSLEEKYNAARQNVDVYQKANPFITFLLFILLIFPGVLYLVKKAKEKKAVIANNEKQEEIMKQCISVGRKLL